MSGKTITEFRKYMISEIRHKKDMFSCLKAFYRQLIRIDESLRIIPYL